jgi:hypothetical protein
MRDRFIPFDASAGPRKWAGVLQARSVIEDEVDARRAVFGLTFSGESVDDGKTTWDLPESAYQQGFRDFFNQPHIPRMRDLGNLLREGAIPAMSALLGSELAEMLCQQYGFTSAALDASTDPSVAMFFATHQAPFYSLVADSSQLGVVYRWPRERAMIAQDLLLQLEGSAFESITTSLRTFIQHSADLNLGKESLVRYTSVTGKHYQRRLMSIMSEGERRSPGALCFPAGAFERSRMGRQRAALLWPDFEVVKPLRSRGGGDVAALIGDLMKTHQGEAFTFRHVGTGLPDQLCKFDLWPSIKTTSGGLGADFRLELRRDEFEFEDRYLEMMLRFFSSCSPCEICLWKLLDSGNRQSGQPIGLVNGVVDLGYLLHAMDAGFIAKRLRTPNVCALVPTLRYIPAENLESFQIDFANAIAS